MKIINLSRFFVEIGDVISYNNIAVKEINRDRKILNLPLWPSAEELNSKNPKVSQFRYINDYFTNKKSIELWVSNDGSYTGLSGIVDGIFVDIWFLNLNGSFSDYRYPLFLKGRR